MDRTTSAVYERHARDWIARRRPRAIESGRLDAFAARVRPGGRVADLGCGPGWYAAHLRRLGFDGIALDLSRAMLVAAGEREPGLPRVRADLHAPPLADGVLDGAFAANCYPHLPRTELPAALARLHAALRVGAPAELTLVDLEDDLPATPEGVERVEGCEGGEAELWLEDGDLGWRLFSAHTRDRARALVCGAGFEEIELERGRRGFWLWVRARRARTLPDFVGAGMRVLVCGLNPSLHAADRGVPFARPGNRFWPAARAAGLIERERDPWDALRRGLGFTDLAKRATARASELAADEYRAGIVRVEALVRLHRPGAVCFVGLDGYRRAVDGRARPGWLDQGFGGAPAYLMPSTSGLNARTSLAALTAHLRAAAGT